MFKRITWMGVGAVAGAATTLWAERKVRDQVDRVATMATPQHLAEVTRTRLYDVRDTVVAAVNEGRETHRDTEANLRQAVADRWGADRRSG